MLFFDRQNGADFCYCGSHFVLGDGVGGFVRILDNIGVLKPSDFKVISFFTGMADH